MLSISFCTLQFKQSINWNIITSTTYAINTTVKSKSNYFNNIKPLQIHKYFNYLPFYGLWQHSPPLLSGNAPEFQLNILDEHSADRETIFQIHMFHSNINKFWRGTWHAMRLNTIITYLQNTLNFSPTTEKRREQMKGHLPSPPNLIKWIISIDSLFQWIKYTT